MIVNMNLLGKTIRVQVAELSQRLSDHHDSNSEASELQSVEYSSSTGL